VSAADAVYYGAEWTGQNISTRGPFGALYRVWGDGKQMVKGDVFDYFGVSGHSADSLRAMGYVVWTPPRPKGEFIAEGDTFTFLNLLDNGLLGYEDSTPGGWAGHGRPSSAAAPAIAAAFGGQNNQIRSYEDLYRLMERIASAPRPPSPDPDFTSAAQNGLAARLKWSVTPAYAAANHEPSVAIRGSWRISARPGETVRLEGVTSDPDGNAVTVRWRRWKDVDTYPGQVTLANPASLATSLQVPNDAAPGQTIQLILEATDNGTPVLTRYQRVVVFVVRTKGG
jgi:hypothetical protein